MKHAKKPTLKQKKLMGSRYKIESWLVLSENKECMKIINRESGNIRTIYK